MHERVTFRLPKQQLEEIDRLVEEGEFPNRSEAIRDAVRSMLGTDDDRPAYLNSRDSHSESTVGVSTTD